MLVVGLTGGIGSGKSTVAGLLAERGAVVIDADQIARQVVEPGQPAHAQLVERFGPGVLAADGSIDRRVLAGIVFADPAALADLNAIVHPRVAVEVSRRLSELPDDASVVLDVPLLVEAGSAAIDALVVVDCPEEVAVRRLVERRGMDEHDVRRRVEAQASREDRRARADRVILNDGSLDDLRRQVEETWAWIRSLAASPGWA